MNRNPRLLLTAAALAVAGTVWTGPALSLGLLAPPQVSRSRLPPGPALPGDTPHIARDALPLFTVDLRGTSVKLDLLSQETEVNASSTGAGVGVLVEVKLS